MPVLTPHPEWLLLSLGLAGWCAARAAAGPRGATLPERLTIAWLACWCVLLLVTLVVGAIPGGLRPLPLCAGLALLTCAVRRWLPAGAAPDWGRDLKPRFLTWQGPERLIWVGLGLAGILLTIQCLRLPPTGVDSLGYHLLGPITWVQQGHWGPIESYWAWASSYPQNVEFLAGFALAHLPHTRYGDAANPLFLLLVFTAFAATARSLGATWLPIGIAALGVLLSPFVIAYASATYTDIPLAGCLLAATALTLAALRTRDLSCALWAWIAICLAAGSKPSALVLLPILGLCHKALLREVWGQLPIVRRFLAIALPFAILTVFWYVRAWIWFGSPFYPWTIALGPLVLFEGPAGPYAAHLESIEPLYVGNHHPYWLGLQRYFGHFEGDLRVQLSWAREWFGPQTSIVGTIAIGWSLWRAGVTKNITWAIVLLLGLGLAALNPAPMVPRFAAHLPFFVALATSLLLTFADRPLRLATQTVLALALPVVLLVLPFSLLPLDENTNLPDQWYAYLGPTYWFSTQLVQPGDTICYVQPLRATGRLIPGDLSARLRYIAPANFSAATVLAPTGTTWLILGDEPRVTRSMGGQNRDAVEAQLRAQAPDLAFRLLATGTTYNLHNYRLYALRPRPEGVLTP